MATFGYEKPTEKRNATAGANAYQKRLRIGGCSPFGAPGSSRITADEATELQRKIAAQFHEKAEQRMEVGAPMVN